MTNLIERIEGKKSDIVNLSITLKSLIEQDMPILLILTSDIKLNEKIAKGNHYYLFVSYKDIFSILNIHEIENPNRVEVLSDFNEIFQKVDSLMKPTIKYYPSIELNASSHPNVELTRDHMGPRAEKNENENKENIDSNVRNLEESKKKMSN
jgi:hypothetical protein